MGRFKNGVNQFDEYESVRFTIEYLGRGKYINSFQMSWGGMIDFQDEEISRTIRLYNHSIKKFFTGKSKDGYFKKNFIYIDGMTPRIFEQGKGLFFPKIFLFLEEEYEKSFVLEYMQSLFVELDKFHLTHPTISFSKYEPKRIKHSNDKGL